MKITLISQKEFNTLTEVFNTNKNLSKDDAVFKMQYNTFFNESEMEVLKVDVKKVNDILSRSICGFSRFQNFIVNKNGETELRFQYNYNYDGVGIPFTGVGYLKLTELLNGFGK